MWNFEQPTKFGLKLPFTDSPVPHLIILTAYILFVFKYGKEFMKNRPPYDIKRIMLAYNAMQVIYNGILFFFCFKYMIVYPVYDLSCIETLPDDHPIKFTEQLTTYCFCMNKLLDLTDTIFFVLRKSYKQITALHVYHHIGMTVGGYLIMRFYGSGGHVNITGTFNSFVHMVMYAYYFLSAFDPKVKASLWWKKYLTILQLVQFVAIFTHTAYVMIFSTTCQFPQIWLWVHLTQSATMLYMFTNFYIKTYMRPKQQTLLNAKTE